MAAKQRVITVNIRGGAGDHKNYMEMDFPDLTKALQDGCTINQIIPIPYTSTNTLGQTAIVFVLDVPVA